MRVSICLLCIIVLALFAVQVVHAGDESGSEDCPAQHGKCVDITEQCDGDFIRDYEACSVSSTNFSCCSYPLYCINGTCKEDNNGTKCKTDDECLMSFYGTGMHKCVNGSCKMIMNANDYCYNDSDCVDDTICDTKVGRCRGYSEGRVCNPPVYPSLRPRSFGLTHYVCGVGLVCAPSEQGVNKPYHCIYGGNESDMCNKTHPCKYSLVCNRGKCIKPFSLDPYTKCDNSQACTCLNGTCAKSTSFVVVKCHSNSDCGEGTNGICGECNHLTGVRTCGFPDTLDRCSSEWRAAYSCYERKRCAPVPGSITDTCVQEQCTTETNDLLSCGINCASFRVGYAECTATLIKRNCPTFPMWARIVTAFTVLFLAVVVVFTVYGISICMAKKNYSHLSST